MISSVKSTFLHIKLVNKEFVSQKEKNYQNITTLILLFKFNKNKLNTKSTGVTMQAKRFKIKC